VDPGNLVDEIPYETNNIWSTHWEFPLTCNDGIKNRDEEGVDCGGRYCIPCNPCDPRATLPSAFDWRDYYALPPVRDQRACSSCWAFAAIGAVEGTFVVEQRGASNFIDLSEQDLISCCNDCGDCMGGFSVRALKYIKNTGVVNETCFRYQSSSCLTGNNCTNACKCDGKCANPCSCNRCQNWNSEVWRIRDYGRVQNDIEKIKRALICYGPLPVVSVNWTHAFVLVGYNDTSGNWTIRNSWGTGWRNNGYGEIPYQGHSYSDLKDHVYYVDSVYRVSGD
ncbi:MAG: C1 family peptidase, partial [Archaeoglobaceae archaeon]